MLDLSPETETILEQEVAREGISVDTLLRRTFTSRRDKPAPKALRLMETIQQWQTEDATEDEDELIRRDQSQFELHTNLDEARNQAGMRPLFSGQE